MNDEIEKILLQHRNDMAAIQAGESDGLDIGTSTNRAKAALNRLLIERAIEELENIRKQYMYENDVPEVVNERIAELKKQYGST